MLPLRFHFFRLWKVWLHFGRQTLKLAQNIISKQAHLDVQFSCHYVVFLIKLFRDQFSHLQVLLSIVRSYVCEVLFSKVGGMIQIERTYDDYDMVESVDARLMHWLELQNLRLILGVQVSIKF